MEILRLYYRSADYRILQATTGHYDQYSHYRFRGKIPWFADVSFLFLSSLYDVFERCVQTTHRSHVEC